MFRLLAAAALAACIATPATAGRIFVVSKEKKMVQVFDAETGALEFEIAGTDEPHQVVLSPDGRRAYTADSNGLKNTLSVIDVGKRAVVGSLVLTPYLGAHGLTLNRAGTKIYATSARARAVLEIQVSPLKITRSYKFFFENVDNVTMTPDEKLVFASSPAGNVVFIDPTKAEFERSVLTGYGAEGLEVSPDGTELWVANKNAQNVAVIDIATRKRVKEIPCHGNPMHVYFTPAGDQVVVTLAVADRLALIDRKTKTEITRFEVGDFPVEMAGGSKGGPLFVTCERQDDVAVVDLAARKVLRRIACGGDPEGIAYSER